MHPPDTIAALATPWGWSARAIVRISGPAVAAVLKNVLVGEVSARRGCFPAVLRLPAERTLEHSPIPDQLELPLLLMRFLAPASYTGEDIAELSFPGNPHLVRRILALLTSIPGVRLALPGEFTARAYLASKMTLEQAEGVAATIAAQTREQLDAARELLAGATGARYRAWADELTTLLALVEAGIDFTDQEDVVAIAPTDLRTRLAALAAALAPTSSRAPSEFRHDLPKVLLVGEPNAGKSTLFNALLARPRAVTSPLAGTTRDVLEETLDLSRDLPGAQGVTLQDSPGLSPSASTPPDASADQQAQRQARAAAHSADALVWCDPSGRFDQAAFARLLDVGPGQRPVIRVRTFADLHAGSPPPPGALDVCGLDGWNLPVLRRAIADAACARGAQGLAALLPRHRRAMQTAAAELRAALDALGSGDSAALHSPETIAACLRAALDQLGELVGRISPDDVIGRIFATFCVGK